MYTKRLFFSAMAFAAMLNSGLASSPDSAKIPLTTQEKENEHSLRLVMLVRPEIGPKENPGPLVDLNASNQINIKGMRGIVMYVHGNEVLVQFSNSVPAWTKARVIIHNGQQNVADGKGPLQLEDRVTFDHVFQENNTWFIDGPITVTGR